MNRTETAIHFFRNKYNCSQAVLAAFAPDFGLDAETAFRVAQGFGAGMGRMGETCGAVAGAFMVLGLMYERADPETKEKVYAMVQQFAREFRRRNGTIACRALLGVDLGTPEGQQEARDQNLFVTRCEKFVIDAAEILEGMLDEVKSR